MPDFADLPLPLRIAGLIGCAQALGLAGYGLAIAVFEAAGSTSGIAGSGADLAPAVLVALYLAFALLALGVSWLLLRGSRRGFTPFLMAQAFGVVVAQPLAAAASTRAVGVVVLASAAAAVAAALMPSARRRLR